MSDPFETDPTIEEPVVLDDDADEIEYDENGEEEFLLDDTVE